MTKTKLHALASYAASVGQGAFETVQERIGTFVVERPAKSQAHWRALLICRARFEKPFHSYAFSGFLDELDFVRREIERRFHELDPAIELARGFFINRSPGLTPVRGFQPRLPMLARKRALIALNALRSVVRITLVSK